MIHLIDDVCKKAKDASFALGLMSESQKNDLLKLMADEILASKQEILRANEIDMELAADKPKHFQDRLKLTDARIDCIVDGIKQIISLKDPVGEVIEDWIAPVNKLFIKKVRVPLGVVGIIYEARPNVTVDTAALCIKSGNAIVLRGSKDAINSNKALVKIMKLALEKGGANSDMVGLIEDTTREGAQYFMTLNQFIDVLVPRGSASLIESTVKNATIPVIETGSGNCHIYIEKTADIEMAKSITVNAKISRPSVCNAAESLLIDEAIYKEYLPAILDVLVEKGVSIIGCEKTCEVYPKAIPATEDDYYKEYLDYIISVKVIKDYNQAIEHINKYSTHHSEAIITKDDKAAKAFAEGVNSAAVYINASTRFTDGGEFGFGAELGISTQKLHARGPVGLRELTSYKYIVTGNGQVR